MVALGPIVKDDVGKFQPSVVMSLLGIERTAFRYWREHLDPNPNQQNFDKTKLFAYRLLASLIKDKHLPVQILEQATLTPIFEWNEILSVGDLNNKWLLLREGHGTIEYVDIEAAIQSQLSSTTNHVMPLKPVLDQYLESFL